MNIIYYDAKVCGAEYIISNLLKRFPHIEHKIEYTNLSRSDARVEVGETVLYIKKIADYNRGLSCLACYFPHHLRGSIEEERFADMAFSDMVGYYDQYRIKNNP